MNMPGHSGTFAGRLPDEMEKSLNLERFGSPEQIPWLEKSWEDDEAFWISLINHHDGLFGNAGKARPFKRYDFFHDLVIRNQQRKNPAFIVYDPLAKTKWQEISYQTLVQEASALSCEWCRSGVKPGDILCIVKPLGISYLRSLLAGLKTGIILSFVLPGPGSWMKKQLESLQPDHISTEQIYHPLLLEWQDKILNEEAKGEKTKGANLSHTYQTREIAALFFDPVCDDPFTPKALTSDLLYLSGIRDGFVGLGLTPGDIVAAPGFDIYLTQPSFLLAALFNGATFLHLPVKDIKKDPDLLTVYPLKTLGITPGVRDILLETPARKVRIWDSWFRDPAASSDMNVWEIFINKQELTAVPAGCMVWNAAMGGCLMFSRRRKGQALQNVLPMPGRKWQFSMMDDNTAGALGGLGLFSVAGFPREEETVYLPTPCLLSRTYLEECFLGLNLPARNGVYYPDAFIREIVGKIDASLDVVVVEVPNYRSDGAPGFHLLVFTGGIGAFDPADIIHRINRIIRTEVGKNFYMDEIKVFPLFPRRSLEDRVDDAWCSSQYQSGWLNNKAKDDLFLGLSGIRAHAFSK